MENLCAYCKSLDFERYMTDDQNLEPAELDLFPRIRERHDCAFCTLVIRALSYDIPTDTNPTSMVYMGGLPDRFGKETASEVDVWTKAFVKSEYTLHDPDDPDGHQILIGRITAVSLAKSQVEGTTVDPDDDGKTNVYSLFASWLNTCRTDHGAECQAQSRTRSQIRLIDVKQMCLVESTEESNYLALSYVWGQTDTFRTLKQHVNGLEAPGGIKHIIDQLPQTIRDAITLTSTLNERYLWVDALCIIQDDEHDKGIQIPLMDLVYDQALATIVALSGTDASSGLPGVATGVITNPTLVKTVHRWNLTPLLPDLEAAYNPSKYATRGWTFQEEILSRRLMFFTEDEVYFQCRQGFVKSSFSEKTKQEDRGIVNPFVRTRKGGDALSSIFRTYTELVGQYTGRQLTHRGDVSNACKGIWSAMNKTFRWNFVSALPEEVFDLALLWRMFPRDLTAGQHGELWQGPSWCWTSWAKETFWSQSLYINGELGISLQPLINHYVVRAADGYRTICRQFDISRGSETEAEALDTARLHMESSDYMKNHGKADYPILIFRASTTRLSHFSISLDTDLLNDPSKSTSPETKRFREMNPWICDGEDRACGTLYYGLSQDGLRNHNLENCEFALLSSCKQSVSDLEKMDAHTRPFDTERYEVVDDWAYNVMLVEWRGSVAVRVAAGQIHRHTWDAIMHGPEKMIVLI
jgi:hypothetical protein